MKFGALWYGLGVYGVKLSQPSYDLEINRLSNRGLLQVVVVNDGFSAVDVALSFNQTFSTDANAIHQTGPIYHNNPKHYSLSGGEFERAATASALIHRKVIGGLKTVLLGVAEVKEKLASVAPLILECLKNHQESCGFDKSKVNLQCIPRVKILRHIGVIALNYDNTIHECSLASVQEDLAYLSRLVNIETVELDELEPTEAPEKPEVNVQPISTSVGLGGSPNDEFYPFQWSMPYGHVSEAWAAIGTWPDKYKPRVAVIDSGVYWDHPDLNANLYVNKAEQNGLPGVDDDGNGYVDDIYGWTANEDGSRPPADIDNHGTHCAGIVGAVPNNGIGVAGVTGPNVELAICRRYDWTGSYPVSYSMECADWALAVGSQVTSHSYGSYYDRHETMSGVRQKAYDALNEAGVLWVNAVGNSYASLGPPEIAHFTSACYNYPNFVNVANLRSDGALAESSNYGEHCVTLAAPGHTILNTADPDKSGMYTYMTGTSMAAPYIAGMAGLLLNVNPYLTAFEMKRVFRESTMPIEAAARPKTLFGGMPNALTAVNLLRPDRLEPADDSRWDDLRFNTRRLEPGQSTTYELKAWGKDVDRTHLGDIIAYGVDVENNYKVLDMSISPVTLKYFIGESSNSAASTPSLGN